MKGEQIHMSYAEFDVPEQLAEKTYTVVEKARDNGKIRKGTNEVTKAVERSNAELVVVAGDVQPEEIVMHIPALCKEKQIPYIFVPSKEELGLAAGLKVETSAVAVSDAGSGKKDLKDVIGRVKELSKPSEPEQEETDE